MRLNLKTKRKRGEARGGREGGEEAGKEGDGEGGREANANLISDFGWFQLVVYAPHYRFYCPSSL